MAPLTTVTHEPELLPVPEGGQLVFVKKRLHIMLTMRDDHICPHCGKPGYGAFGPYWAKSSEYNHFYHYAHPNGKRNGRKWCYLGTLVSSGNHQNEDRVNDPRWRWAHNSLVSHRRCGHGIELTREQIYDYAKRVIFCEDCGSKLVWEHGHGRSERTPALDRRDNKKPAAIDNIAIICHKCNGRKGARSLTGWRTTLSDEKENNGRAKYCEICWQLKPLDQFRFDGRHYRGECKACKIHLGMVWHWTRHYLGQLVGTQVADNEDSTGSEQKFFPRPLPPTIGSDTVTSSPDVFTLADNSEPLKPSSHLHDRYCPKCGADYPQTAKRKCSCGHFLLFRNHGRYS